MRAGAAIRAVARQAVHNANIPRNRVKGDWRQLSRRRLMWLLTVEVWELFVAVATLARLEAAIRHCDRKVTTVIWADRRDELLRQAQETRDHIRYEAGDVVAFAAFIVDKSGR